MYYYNVTAEKCDEFEYGGCRGNHNRQVILNSIIIHRKKLCIPVSVLEKENNRKIVEQSVFFLVLIYYVKETVNLVSRILQNLT